jgi:hypothetical protein
MFKSLFGAPKPVYDPALGDSLGISILAEAKLGRLDTLLKEIDRFRVGKWDARAFYLDLAAENIPNTVNLEKLPDTPVGNLIKGAGTINLAWKARGRGDAKTVSEVGWVMFHDYLHTAGKHLTRASQQDAEDPTPFAFLQTVAMGLELERKFAQTWLQEALKRDPTNQQAHLRHLWVLCKKWGGSHEEMYAFARETMQRIPWDSTLNSILYCAFHEHYLYFIAFDQDQLGARRFIMDNQIRAESIAVYEKSLKNRKVITQAADYYPHNLTAWWFLTLKVPEVVRVETKKIGPYFTKYPWSIYHPQDPAAAYQKAANL